MTLYDKDIERSVLALMIMKPELIPNICNEVCGSDFFYDINRDIFNIINKLKQTQRRVDLPEISNEYKREYVYIAQITDAYQTIYSDNWKYYAETVRRYSMARGLIGMMEELHDITDQNVEDKISFVQSRVNKISDNSGGSDIRRMSDVAKNVIDRITTAFNSGGRLSGYDWGFEGLNRITNGIQKELVIIGARASVGKTGLAINTARSLVKNKIPTGYFSLEMSAEALQLRLLADIASVPMGKLRSGDLSPDQVNRVNKAGIEILDYPLFIVDKIRGDLSKIVSRIRYMVRVLGVKVIFIDHVSLIKHNDKRLKRFEQFTEISNELQALQRELNIPLIILAQLGRDSEGQMPTIADLRESGSFEQDADQIILLHRERATDADKIEIPTKFYVAKNRNGACGITEVAFYPQYVRFSDKETKK